MATENVGYQPLNAADKKNARLITIEPIICFFMLGDGIYYGLQSEFIQGRIADVHNYTLPNNNDENGTCSLNASSPENKLQADIEAEASNWVMYITIAYTLPSVFMTLVLGSWSDSVGRKPAILITSVGTLLNLISWTIVAALNLPLEILIASEMLRGMSGGTSLLTAACFTYISDVTTTENRTTRIIACEFVFLVSLSCGQFSGGFLVDQFSFEIAYSVALSFTFISIIYTTIPYLLRETIVAKIRFKESIKKQLVGISAIWTEKDLEYKKTFVVISVVFFIATVFTSVMALLTLHFLAEPFCFSYLMVSYYTAALALASTIGKNNSGRKTLAAISIIIFSGLLLSVVLLKRWLNDYWLIHLSMLSAILFNMVSSVAKTTTIAFVGKSLNPVNTLLQYYAVAERLNLRLIQITLIAGAVFGFFGLVNSLGGFISPLVLNNIYSATVHTMPTFVFWMCGSFSLIPIISVW
ncbi:lysosomal proton-coupled steroid conjugate and bile acid symporter SLC46A3-like [Antedon mediterranea]|uniref:lysosomal proton-coupled steroid conjugate and bile acid symporter SLC46A3-like n=1 Tax=Antedon mediterranea TaxID=105859 RepID=UPI003AF70769